MRNRNNPHQRLRAFFRPSDAPAWPGYGDSEAPKDPARKSNCGRSVLFSDEQRKRICDSPDSISSLARRYNVSNDTIYRVKRQGPDQPKPKRNPKAKLTDEQARDVILSKDTLESLARKYGLNHSTIRNIRDRRTYKWVKI